MKKIYSKVDPSLLLHQINRLEDITEGKRNLSDPKEFLQICTMNLEKGRAFHSHKHIWKDGEKSVIAQESWIVIRGKVKGIFYDIDDTIIEEEILNPGDCSITFQGGHNLISLDENTILYEIKTGPYKGRENDKIDI